MFSTKLPVVESTPRIRVQEVSPDFIRNRPCDVAA
jgi:hypothetical protein